MCRMVLAVMLPSAISWMLPQAKPSQKRVVIAPRSATQGKLFQLLNIASPNDDIIRIKSFNQTGDSIHHMLAPFLLSESFRSATSFLTPKIMCSGDIFGPDGNLRGALCPLARIFTLVPPTSTTSTFMVKPQC